ncbi:hypothetical protein STEG23_003196, partial [Scotinomys teguina]
SALLYYARDKVEKEQSTGKPYTAVQTLMTSVFNGQRDSGSMQKMDLKDCKSQSQRAKPENMLCCSDFQISHLGVLNQMPLYKTKIDSGKTAQLENKPKKPELAAA